VPELDFFRVEDDPRPAYGGNQQWYADRWQRQAGCASVAAANLAACLLPGVLPPCPGGRPCPKAAFVTLMERLYRLMRPTVVGFPWAGAFRRQFLRFAQQQGRPLRAVTCAGGGWQRRLAFVRACIAAGCPVALLTAVNASPALRGNRWHWMTLTGWLPAEDGRPERVVVSNCGAREEFSAADLLGRSPSLLRLICFLPADGAA